MEAKHTYTLFSFTYIPSADDEIEYDDKKWLCFVCVRDSIWNLLQRQVIRVHVMNDDDIKNDDCSYSPPITCHGIIVIIYDKLVAYLDFCCEFSIQSNTTIFL